MYIYIYIHIYTHICPSGRAAAHGAPPSLTRPEATVCLCVCCVFVCVCFVVWGMLLVSSMLFETTGTKDMSNICVMHMRTQLFARRCLRTYTSTCAPLWQTYGRNNTATVSCDVISDVGDPQRLKVPTISANGPIAYLAKRFLGCGLNTWHGII